MTMSSCLHCLLANFCIPLSGFHDNNHCLQDNIPLPLSFPMVAYFAFCHGNMLLPPGISCARAPRQTEDSSSGEPYGKQALYFTKELIMHREVVYVPPSLSPPHTLTLHPHYHPLTSSHFLALCTLTLHPHSAPSL